MIVINFSTWKCVLIANLRQIKKPEVVCNYFKALLSKCQRQDDVIHKMHQHYGSM